eukprot:GHVQ01035379.1.p1 GENE.GHVQ01035379.1~~GHVQ01035379.1.p1  ORF type:complete len:102 (+),score=18.28 GHVQ01035379.1:72-377(+)
MVTESLVSADLFVLIGFGELNSWPVIHAHTLRHSVHTTHKPTHPIADTNTHVQDTLSRVTIHTSIYVNTITLSQTHTHWHINTQTYTYTHMHNHTHTQTYT